MNAGAPLLRDQTGDRPPGFLEIVLTGPEVVVNHHFWKQGQLAGSSGSTSLCRFFLPRQAAWTEGESNRASGTGRKYTSRIWNQWRIGVITTLAGSGTLSLKSVKLLNKGPLAGPCGKRILLGRRSHAEGLLPSLRAIWNGTAFRRGGDIDPTRIDPLIGDSFPFLAFFLAIVLTARYGGFGPSLLALVLAWFSFDQLFLQPPRPLPFFRSKYQLVFGFFVVGLTVILLCEFTKVAQRLAKESTSKPRRHLKTLRANRERLRITLASIGDAVIATDANGRVDSLNPAAEKLTGWRADEAAGLLLRRGISNG